MWYPMKSRTLIAFTFIIPVIILLLYGAVSLLHLGEREYPLKIREKNHLLYGADGTTLPLTLTTPSAEETLPGAVLMVPDRKLDRDWNARGVSFETGRDIARMLSGNGMPVIRYDQRESGDSILSGTNYSDMENTSSAFQVLYNYATEELGYDPASMVLIGHGDGCMSLLRAVNRFQLRARRIVLLGCAYKGTLLESWGERILYNMEKTGADPEVRKRARQELRLWLARMEGHPLPEMPSHADEKMENHPDIMGFRKALEYMESAKMLSFTEQAAKLDFEKELRKVLQSRHPVTHLVGAMDDELPPEEIRKTEELEKRLQLQGYPCELRIVEEANHFFKPQSKRSTAIFEMLLNRLSPFSQTSENFLNMLQKTVLPEQ